MAEIWAGLYIALMCAVLLLNVLSLPANWIVLALVALWKFTHPGLADLTWGFVAVVGVIAAVGEGLEFAGQAYGAKKFGATGKGNLGGIVGAIAGAIFGAPFLFGLGALIGALAGAFGGCLLFEIINGREMAEARKAAWGAFWGKAFGFSVKTGLGVIMVAISAPRIWP